MSSHVQEKKIKEELLSLGVSRQDYIKKVAFEIDFGG